MKTYIRYLDKKMDALTFNMSKMMVWIE